MSPDPEVRRLALIGQASEDLFVSDHFYPELAQHAVCFLVQHTSVPVCVAFLSEPHANQTRTMVAGDGQPRSELCVVAAHVVWDMLLVAQLSLPNRFHCALEVGLREPESASCSIFVLRMVQQHRHGEHVAYIMVIGFLLHSSSR